MNHKTYCNSFIWLQSFIAKLVSKKYQYVISWRINNIQASKPNHILVEIIDSNDLVYFNSEPKINTRVPQVPQKWMQRSHNGLAHSWHSGQ